MEGISPASHWPDSMQAGWQFEGSSPPSSRLEKGTNCLDEEVHEDVIHVSFGMADGLWIGLHGRDRMGHVKGGVEGCYSKLDHSGDPPNVQLWGSRLGEGEGTPIARHHDALGSTRPMQFRSGGHRSRLN